MKNASPTDLQFRKLTQGDLDPLEALTRVLPFGSSWTSDALKGELERGLAYGGFLETRLCCFILLRPPGEAYEIQWLGTGLEHHGKGFMSALWQFVLAELPSAAKVWLEVHESNLSARKFYEKAGFVRVGLRPRYYRDGGAAILYNFQIGVPPLGSMNLS